MRSMTIAQNRIARPASIPWPLAAYWSAMSTSCPRLLAPMSDAMTTIERHIRMVWLATSVSGSSLLFTVQMAAV